MTDHLVKSWIRLFIRFHSSLVYSGLRTQLSGDPKQDVLLTKNLPFSSSWPSCFFFSWDCMEFQPILWKIFTSIFNLFLRCSLRICLMPKSKIVEYRVHFFQLHFSINLFWLLWWLWLYFLLYQPYIIAKFSAFVKTFSDSYSQAFISFLGT